MTEPTDVTEESVTFHSDGLRLAATLVAPAHADGAPGLVMSHGWSGAVNHRQLPLARKLAESGYVSLVLDHRGFGDSEGPRARCVPELQVRDVASGLTYLGARADVDADALGIVGVSFGGAIAIGAGARDPRAKAVASIVGIGNGERWLRSLRPFHQWCELRDRIEADRVARATTGVGERVDFTVLMPGPDAPAIQAEYETMRAAQPDGYPLENAFHAMTYRPEELIGSIAPRAVALIGCADDTVVPVDETVAMYEAAGEPRTLVVFPEGNHGGPLGPLVDDTAAALVAFLDPHLRPGRSR